MEKISIVQTKGWRCAEVGQVCLFHNIQVDMMIVPSFTSMMSQW